MNRPVRAGVDIDAAVRRVDERLLPHVVPARREFLARGYAPTALRWLGVPVPAVRGVVREMARELAEAPPEDVLRLALALAQRGSIEARQVGYEVVARRRDASALLDRRRLEQLGHGHDNWAAVDAFAAALTGPAWRERRLSDADVLAWARSHDPWWRRTAVVSAVSLNTVSRGGHGDARRTLLVCRAVVRDLTPMLGKALSWALRSLVPHDPASVRGFLREHGDALPAFVRRDVSAKLETGRKTRAARA